MTPQSAIRYDHRTDVLFIGIAL